ncbi:putative ribonuclease H-like domain-containing protein [Tanacetum coccineum]
MMLLLLNLNLLWDEVKDSVWSCVGSKAPGPDCCLGNRCNASFVVLIPKKNDPLGFSDYRHISLIRCVYKIISKLLASRLAWVIDSVVGPNQSAFIEDEMPRTLSIFSVGNKRLLSVVEVNAASYDCYYCWFKLQLLGEYDMWRLRIEQYFQVHDYALWDVIENENSFKPAAQTIINADGTSTSLILGPVTTEEKVQKKNDVKARNMLLMALPNEHLMTFNQYKDAKTLFAAIQTRFGGNEATKKTQKTLLKKMYENFSAPNTESLDSIFNRLQKIVSQLAILGENISQEDLNLKFLRSLPSEWNTHVVVWRNKPDLDTMSFDDLYNNFKIKGINKSTNEVNTAYGVSTANTQVSSASTQVSTPSTQKTGRKITINGSDTAGYDKSKVECFNCHKIGHLARECRGPRNQDSRNRNQDSSRRTVNVEETSSKAMVAIDRADSEVNNDKTCSKTYLTSFETLKTQLDDLRIEFNKFEFNLATYKRGLASVEEQLVFYKKNEVIFCEQLVVHKRDISYKDSEISMLKSELEKLKQEKESNQLKIENFDNASKRLFSPPKFDLSNSSLEEFQQPEFEGYGPKTSKSVCKDISNKVRESPDVPLVKELVSDDKLEKKTVSPTVAKIEFVRPKQQEKPVRKPVKYAKMYSSQSPRGNQRNWNNQKSQQLGSDFVMYNKACFVCGSFDHVQANCNYHQRKRVVSRNNYTRVNYKYSSKKAHPSAHRNMAPRAVLMKTGLRPLNTVRPVNTAHPKTIGHPQKEDQGYVDSGCSRHMTGNMSYLSDFKEFNGGYVTFRGGAKGGKITGKGTLKTGKLDFEDVYFVKELQFNLFSVSQMCDKKNNVLFTDTGCFVLSPDFKLADESQVLLKVPRKNNMYSVDMKNIVPKESLTCLVAKATLDESMLWHRRLGHVNFKTINKLVKENLVRGLPIKRFENDQTCVACLKGKQHKASCKSKIQNSITQPLFMLHMDLFGLTFVSSLMNKKYYLVVTDDYSRFTWVFFLATKDETSGILKSFITEVENLVDKKVKIIRCDNGTEFKNRVMSEFCEKKGIKKEFSVARTPQQNGVAERRILRRIRRMRVRMRMMRERESQGLDDEGQEEEEAAPEGQQQGVPIVDTAMSEPLVLKYGETKCYALESTKEIAPYTYKVGQSSRHRHLLSGRLVPYQFHHHPQYLSLIASPVATLAATISVDKDQFLEVGAHLELYGSILHDHTQRLDALPSTLFEGYDRDLRELYTRSRAVRDEIFL